MKELDLVDLCNGCTELPAMGGLDLKQASVCMTGDASN